MPLNSVPQANQTLAQTQNPILQNFATINADFLVNHVELGTAGAGKHKTVTLVNQTNAPTAPVTGALESAIYSAPSLFAPNAPALFIKGQNSGAGVDGLEITYALKSTIGWTYLPSGMILQWGTETIASGGSTKAFARTFTTANYSVQVTSADPSTNAKVFSNVSAKSTAGFTVRLRGQNGGDIGGDIYYLAIGY